MNFGRHNELFPAGNADASTTVLVFTSTFSAFSADRNLPNYLVL